MGNTKTEHLKMNIDALGQKIFYYQGETLMELVNMNMVKSVEADGRSFIFKDGMLCEICENENGVILINWKFRNVNVGSRGAMGFTTQAKVEVLRTYDLDAAYTLQNFGRYAEQDTYSTEVWKKKGDNTYFFSIEGTEYKVKKLKDLYKAFPDAAKQLKSFAKSNQLTMENAADAVRIIDYLRTLL